MGEYMGTVTGTVLVCTPMYLRRRCVTKVESMRSTRPSTSSERNTRNTLLPTARVTSSASLVNLRLQTWIPSVSVLPTGGSIRIGRDTDSEGKGYFEDRRPSSNCDPYTVSGMIMKTITEDIEVPVIEPMNKQS